MVVQKKVTNIPKTKIKKSLKDGESSHKNLAGPREAIAMEVLHMMFMKKLAQNSNFIVFQNKKNYVDKKILQTGIEKTMEECFQSPSQSDDDSETSEYRSER